MIRKSRAKIVIFASENVPDSYISAIDQNSGDAKANLVMTLDRKGPAFANFFARLFSEMFKGKTMPMAWVKLAPQDPNDPHENCPETIFAAEISHIVFQ